MAERWLRENREWNEWFCYVDSFDVHEPFHVPEPYASMYTDEDPRDPELVNWPFYGRTDRGQSELTERQIAFVRSQFAGKTTMVDRWFGRVLNALDDKNLWRETMVVVTADHGHYLGEHGWMGKPHAPLYNILAHTPLMIWHPDSPHPGGHVSDLTAAVDLYATVLDTLDLDEPDRRHSRNLVPLLHDENGGTNHRDWALYGYWGSSVNITDGEYTYLRPCDVVRESYCYSTQMMKPYGRFTPNDPQYDAEVDDFLPYTKSPVWRYSAPSYARQKESMLFDVRADSWQEDSLVGEKPEAEERMRLLLIEALNQLDAPAHQYDRLTLT